MTTRPIRPTRSIQFATAATAAVALLSFASLASAQPAPASCRTVEVQNLRPSQGPLMLAAYDAAERFGKTPVTQMQVEASASTLVLQVCGLTGPEVALMLFQDLNRNGKLDKNPFGIPNEPWAASGRPALMGPSWESASVPATGEPIVIRMPD